MDLADVDRDHGRSEGAAYSGNPATMWVVGVFPLARFAT